MATKLNTGPAQSIIEQVAVEEIAPGHYQTRWLPGRMGNSMPIAYGGCTLGAATRAAYETVAPTHSVYSLMGHFHGPASTEQPLIIVVHRTRDTKTFATRRIEVKQLQSDGQTTRSVMELLADFHVAEVSAMEDWSPRPSKSYAHWTEQPVAMDDHGQAKIATAARKMFEMNERFFETRQCREGVSGQKLFGMLKRQETTQDSLPLAERTSAEWTRSRHDLSDHLSGSGSESGSGTGPVVSSRGDRAAAVAWLMDGGLAFLPLTHNHMWFDDVGPCSSLDFSLRFMVPDIDLSREWHLRERSTISGGAGRTYTEGRLWDGNGTLVASVTQQSIMRRKPGEPSKGKTAAAAAKL